jgi:signal transduction histidine kinase
MKNFLSEIVLESPNEENYVEVTNNPKKLQNEYLCFVNETERKIIIVAGIFSVVFYLVNFSFIFFFESSFLTTFLFFFTIFNLICDLLITFFLLNGNLNKFWHISFKFLKIVLMISTIMLYAIYYQLVQKSKIDVSRSVTTLLFIMMISYLFFLDSKFIFICFFALLVLSLLIFLTLQKEENYFIDICSSLMTLSTVYFLRRYQDSFYSKICVEMTKNEKIASYFNKMIDSLKSMIITFVNNKVININSKYLNFLEHNFIKFNKDNEIETEKLTNLLLSVIKDSKNVSLREYLESIKEDNSINKDFIKLGVFGLKLPDVVYYYEILYRKIELNKNYLIDLIFNDITEIKIAEKLESENKYKQLFLAKIAHEFKTPLISIIGIIDKIKSKLNQQNISNKIDTVLSLSYYSIFLVDDIIHYTEMNRLITKFDKSVINLRELSLFCFKVLKSLIKYKGLKEKIKVTSEYDEKIDRISIFSDELRLKQIILNLITNAIKFTKYGFIKLKYEFNEELKEVIINVQDSGVGIESHKQTTLIKEINLEIDDYNRKGSGFGLSICNSLAIYLDHKITFISEYQKGSIFKVHLNSINNDSELANKNRNSLREGHLKLYDPNFFLKETPRMSKMTINETIKLKLFKENDIFFKRKPSLDNQKTNIKSTENCKKKHFTQTIERFTTTLVDSNFELLDQEKKEDILHNTLLSDDQLQDENYSEIRKSVKILVIDDYVYIREGLKSIIEEISNKMNIDIDIELGEDGIDLLNQVITSQRLGFTYTLIFVDENMNFMNGSKAIGIIRELEKDQKIKRNNIITVTAFEDEATKSNIMNAGSDIILSKPCRASKIKELIEKYCL